MAAVGPLQFEVVQSRMLSEYGVEVRLETLPYTCARWAMAGWDEVEAAEKDNQASPAAPAPPPGPPAPRTLRLMVARLAAMLAAARSPPPLLRPVRQLYGVMQLEDAYGRPVLLFNADWKMNKVVADSGERLQLRPFAVAPDVEEKRRK